ncbi:glycosyltransferase family 4 protein [Desulfobacterota bacterium AH_259_B03_O07]|nr:glycosyltransferase family 4 protein [Desulfobacterota bacterium AH_259_B03_O07]
MEISFYRHSLFSRGGDRMVVEYANYLAEKGYKVIIWYNTLNTVFKLHPQLKLVKIPLPTRLGTIIHASLKKFQSDVIIVDIIPLASLLSIRNRLGLIYFAQGYDESYYRNTFRKLLTKLLYLFSLKVMKVKTIAVSNELAQMLKEKYDARVRTVENGIDFDTFYPDPDEELIAIKGDRKSVLLLSRDDHTKGLDIAVKVINKLSDEWKDKIEIWTCGEELKTETLKTKIRNFGWIGKDRLRKVLSSGDILFYPTRYEGFPLFPLEAMACGCPVVTTRAVLYVKDGENALVTEIEDTDILKEKLESILRDDLLREKMRKNGFKTATKYDLKKSRGSFEKIISDVFNLSSNLPSDKPTIISSK